MWFNVDVALLARYPMSTFVDISLVTDFYPVMHGLLGVYWWWILLFLAFSHHHLPLFGIVPSIKKQ